MTREPFEFRFVLEGLPPSTNALYAPVSATFGSGARFRKKPRAAAWNYGAQLALQAAWRRAGNRRPVERHAVELRLWFGVKRINADTSNRIKALEDALTGIAWRDDCQVVEVSARKEIAEREHVIGVVRLAAGVGKETQKRIAKAKKAGGT